MHADNTAPDDEDSVVQNVQEKCAGYLGESCDFDSACDGDLFVEIMPVGNNPYGWRVLKESMP